MKKYETRKIYNNLGNKRWPFHSRKKESHLPIKEQKEAQREDHSSSDKSLPQNTITDASEAEKDFLECKGEVRSVESQNMESQQMNYGVFQRIRYGHLSQRDTIYTDFLQEIYVRYKERLVNKERAKWEFYDNMMSIFYCVLFILLLLTALLIAGGASNNSLGECIPAVITALITILATLIVIPKIIAEYLFNPKEDADVTKIVLEMQSHDFTDEKSEKPQQKNEGNEQNEK